MPEIETTIQMRKSQKVYPCYRYFYGEERFEIRQGNQPAPSYSPPVRIELIVEQRRAILKYTSNTFSVFVENATVGVNTVMKNILFEPEDIILHNSHTYRACAKVI